MSCINKIEKCLFSVIRVSFLERYNARVKFGPASIFGSFENTTQKGLDRTLIGVDWDAAPT